MAEAHGIFHRHNGQFAVSQGFTIDTDLAQDRVIPAQHPAQGIQETAVNVLGQHKRHG